ncbi:MAG: hypothetical protein HY080_09585 [Gammaproteobacteria bacterium]|nr:hypothetical protein [Gammaproteobacteria bacterium]
MSRGLSNKILIAGCLLCGASLPVFAAEGDEVVIEGDAYRQCIEGVVFELKRKTQGRVNFNWSKEGELYVNYSDNAITVDIGPDSPEQTLYTLEKDIDPNVTTLDQSLVHQRCGSGSKK